MLASRDRAELVSVLMGLSTLTGSASGFHHSAALQRLPEQLALSGEARVMFHQHFRGGVAELRAKLVEAQQSLDAVLAVTARIDKVIL